MAYSTDTRNIVLNYLAKGHSYKEANKELGVGITTMKSWKRLLNETGSLEKRPLERIAKKFHAEKLETYINEHPDALLQDIAEEFGGSVSGAYYACEREKLTFKKEPFYSERDEEKRHEFDEKMSKPMLPDTDIVYIDECGDDKFMGREYGRSKRGKRVYLPEPIRKYKRINIDAG